MKVLMFSTDRKIFDEESEVRGRMSDYGLLFDELRVIVFTDRKKNYQTVRIKNNVWIHPTNSWSRWLYVLDAARMGEKMVRSNESWVISAQDPFETGLAAWWVAFYNRLNFQVQIHTDLFSPYFRRGSLLNRLRILIALFVLPRATSIRVVSERIKRSLGVLMLRSEPSVLPVFSESKERKEGAVDLCKLYPEFDFTVLMASRLTPEKNIKLGIQTVEQVEKISSKKLGLVVVGSGREQKRLKKYVEKNNLEEIVKFEPWTENLPAYYKTADLFLLTSNFEGYCRTLVEAALSACPILTTDVGLVGEALNRENCLVCPVAAKECLVSKLKNAIENKEALKQMSFLAKEAVEKSLLSKKEYLSLYADLLEKCYNSKTF